VISLVDCMVCSGYGALHACRFIELEQLQAKRSLSTSNMSVPQGSPVVLRFLVGTTLASQHHPCNLSMLLHRVVEQNDLR
jgi:hypothetical protein